MSILATTCRRRIQVHGEEGKYDGKYENTDGVTGSKIRGQYNEVRNKQGEYEGVSINMVLRAEMGSQRRSRGEYDGVGEKDGDTSREGESEERRRYIQIKKVMVTRRDCGAYENTDLNEGESVCAGEENSDGGGDVNDYILDVDNEASGIGIGVCVKGSHDSRVTAEAGAWDAGDIWRRVLPGRHNESLVAAMDTELKDIPATEDPNAYSFGDRVVTINCVE